MASWRLQLFGDDHQHVAFRSAGRDRGAGKLVGVGASSRQTGSIQENSLYSAAAAAELMRFHFGSAAPLRQQVPIASSQSPVPAG